MPRAALAGVRVVLYSCVVLATGTDESSFSDGDERRPVSE
jgi:hypothetical protein